MTREQKIKLLEAIERGEISPELIADLSESGTITYTFRDIQGKPGYYIDRGGKEYSEDEKAEFTRKIVEKAKASKIIGGAEYLVITVNRGSRNPEQQKQFEADNPDTMHVSLNMQ